MDKISNISSEEELLQLRNDGKISEAEYCDLRSAMARSARRPEEPAQPRACGAASKHNRGRIALIVMLAGVVLPALGYAVAQMLAGPNQHPAIGPWFFVGVAFQVVGFALGISAWPDAYAKATVITISAIGVFVILLISLFWLSRAESQRARRDMARAEMQRVRARQAPRLQPMTTQSVALKSYPLDDREGLLTQSGVRIDEAISSDGNGSLRIDTTKPTTIRLFETGDLDIENARLIYQARVRTENMQGQVYLEMWCHFPGKGEFFSKGLMTPLTGTTDWTTAETPFLLKEGENPDNIRLNLVIDGKGTVWIDDIRLLKGVVQ